MNIYYSFVQNDDEKKVSRELLKKAFQDRGYELDLLTIDVQKHGKPYVKNVPFEFNISHTKGFACVVVGDNVGIDCEIIREVKQSVISRVCSDEEIELVGKSLDKAKEFIRLWTFKEAFTKMLGSGFRYPFKNTTIYNAMYLHPNIKIYQKIFGDVMLCAIERSGEKVNIIEI